MGTQTRRDSLTCDRLGMQLLCPTLSTPQYLVLLLYLPVLLYLIKIVAVSHHRRPFPAHFRPACRDCVCLPCPARLGPWNSSFVCALQSCNAAWSGVLLPILTCRRHGRLSYLSKRRSTAPFVALPPLARETVDRPRPIDRNKSYTP